MSKRTAADAERRRSPRFTCGGYANISCLPSEGVILPGAIRDLSLGGCHLDTALPIDAGRRAEILVRVNSASFRAIGEVKALRQSSGVGLEFVQLSAGGKDMLANLVTDLARLQAVMNQLKGTRRDIDAESFKEELERGRLRARSLAERFPFFRTTLSAENTQESLQKSSQKRPQEKSDTDTEAANGSSAEPPLLVLRVDLFG